MKSSRQGYDLSGKLHESFELFKNFRGVATIFGFRVPGRCLNFFLLLPNTSLSASLTFPEYPSIKIDGCAPIGVRRSYGHRIRNTVVRPIIRSNFVEFFSMKEALGMFQGGARA